jgi:ribose transport system ATP-binding protein
MADASKPAMPAPEIVVEGVSKAFGETRALNDCSLQARIGEIHAIVGENGSGKSTLAKILSGVIRADTGSVSIFGVTPRNPWEARRLGVATIFQEILVANEASIVDNLFVGSDAFLKSSPSRPERRKIAAELVRRLALVDIDPDSTAGNLPPNIKQ